MSHQTGIHASDELKVVFAKCKSQREIRCLKLSIDKEKLVCDETKPMSVATPDWKQDWRSYMVSSFMPKQRPCYVLFRIASALDNQEIVVAPPTNSKPNKSSFVSKLPGPPKLSSILTSSLKSSSSSSNQNNSSNNNNNNNSPSSPTKNNNNNNNSESKNHDQTATDQASEVSKDQWLFVSWTPESSSVREKMIYASTKSTVKQEFGSGSIFADYFVASTEDLSLESVTKWIERKQHIRGGRIDMNELSLSEQELQQVKMDEAALCADLLAAAINSKDKQNQRSLPNIEMPIADEAITAMYDFKQGKTAYVQFSIDPKSETILLEKYEPAGGFDLSKKSIASLTPKDHARYHLISYNHQHNKKQVKSTLFVYSIPSSGCPVKERMLYSSVKNSLLQVIQEESKIGISVDRRIETDDPSELNEKFLYDELYPADASQSTPTAFAKPKGPAKQTPSSRRRVM